MKVPVLKAYSSRIFFYSKTYRTHCGKACRTEPCGRAGAGEEWDEEGKAEINRWAEHSPIPHPTVPLVRRREGNPQWIWACEKGRVWGESVLRFGCIYHWPTLIWSYLSKLIWFGSVLPVTVIGEWCLPALISTHYYIFPPLSSWKKKWQSSMGGHLVSSQHQPGTRCPIKASM